MMKLFIENVIYDFSGISLKGEDYNDTSKRLGLPCYFIVEVDANNNDDREFINHLARKSVYDHICERFGKKLADGIEAIGWRTCKCEKKEECDDVDELVTDTVNVTNIKWLLEKDSVKVLNLPQKTLIDITYPKNVWVGSGSTYDYIKQALENEYKHMVDNFDYDFEL